MANADTKLDLSQLLESGRFSDLVLKCQGGGELQCHRTVIFEQGELLKHEPILSGVIAVEGPSVIWKLMLEFLYTGNYEVFHLERHARAALFTDAKILSNNVDLMHALSLFCKWDAENTNTNEAASRVRPVYFEDPGLREKLDPILANYPRVALQVLRQITSGPFEGKRIVSAAATSPIDHPTTSMAKQDDDNVASTTGAKRENGESDTRPQADIRKCVKTEDDAESTANTSDNGTVRCEEQKDRRTENPRQPKIGMGLRRHLSCAASEGEKGVRTTEADQTFWEKKSASRRVTDTERNFQNGNTS